MRSCRVFIGSAGLAGLLTVALLSAPMSALAGPARSLIRDANGTYIGVRASIVGDTLPSLPSSGASIGAFSRMGICTTAPYGTCSSSGNGITIGQYQFGHVSSYDDPTTCSAGGFIDGHCQEWLTLGGDHSFHGIGYPAEAFSDRHQYTVVRDPAAGYWRVYYDGVYLDKKGPLGFDTGAPVAVAEWLVSAPSNFNERWGGSGNPVWQSKANGASSFVDISGFSREIVNTNSFSRVGTPPATFTLNK